MIKVKISTNTPYWPIERQLKNQDRMLDKFKFVVNKNDPECDFWIIAGGLEKAENCHCLKENIFFITTEPPDIHQYNKDFLTQFHTIVTCDRNINHQNPIYTQPGLQWMIGASINHEKLKLITAGSKHRNINNVWNNFMSHEALNSTPINKTKLLSIVASKKEITAGHKKRNQLIDALKHELNDKFDVFGIGYSPMKDKWDAIAPYKYHLAIENSQINDYWTEKIADAYLGEALPIYSGCPNIESYFEPDSLINIDYNKTDKALNIILGTIEQDIYQTRKESIINAKRKVLNEYNFFPYFSNLLLYNSAPNREQHKLIEIKPEDTFHKKSIFKKIVTKFKAS